MFLHQFMSACSSSGVSLTTTHNLYWVLQLSQLQAELDDDWKRKSEQMLATAKEQHSRELTDLSEQRDALQDKVTQLEEKVKHTDTHTFDFE